VWATGTMYPKNFGGVMMSYTLALPFFRNAVEGDLFFTAAMFATPVALKALYGVFGRAAGGATA